MPPNSLQPRSTTIGIVGDIVDELPLDAETSLITGEHVKFAEFLAYVKNSRIDTKGELIITFAIPFEFKYEAMPLTDLRGVMFVMQAHRPMRKEEIEYRKSIRESRPPEEWIDKDD